MIPHRHPPPLVLTCRIRTADRKRKAAKDPAKTARAERRYAQNLRKIGEHVGQLVSGFDINSEPALQALLNRYAEALTPWAERTAVNMLAEVDARDRQAWRELGNAISRGLADLIQRAPVGVAMKKLLDEQVVLIKSLPLDAGKRVHELTLKALEDSTRAREISKEIGRTGEVTESRALLIARTEVSRTASVLVEARAQASGLTHYIWRTARDGAVRPGHKAMEGKVCEWANPPAVEENGRIMRFHAGQIWNCRCYPEPIITD